ncbi:hypothetical protein [Trinickia soli]|uniref:hypothetical protein n=1 Tax=Trinickia soli TaxID=380675 RepID=UPI001E3BF63B|nr:hypothetical protein [Trinickia soli]
MTLTIGMFGAAPVKPDDTVIAVWLAASVGVPVPPVDPVEVLPVLVPPVLPVPLVLLFVLPSETLLEPPPPQPATNATAVARMNAPSVRPHLLSIRKIVLSSISFVIGYRRR